MGIKEKIDNARGTDWVSRGLQDSDIKSTIELAKIQARIERCRLDLGMTQKEFAVYMGVSQGMISKWESREYNFTINTLNEICHKLNLELSVDIQDPCNMHPYKIVTWDKDIEQSGVSVQNWVKNLKTGEAIA